MKKIILSSILACVAVFSIQAQQPPDIRIGIMKAISKNTAWESVLKRGTNSVYLFSIGLSYDTMGKVDTVYFSSKMSKDLREVLNTKQLIPAIKNLSFLTGLYKSKIVVFPVLYKNNTDGTMKYDETFIQSWQYLWPDIITTQHNKEVVLLQPYENNFSRIEN